MAVEAVRPARQRGREIEPEAVDVAGLDPMAQRVHDHRADHRMREIERIPAAGEILVEARLAVLEPVVGLVVDAAEAQRPPEMIALGGVVVDDVEDHLDAGVVQALDRRAKRIKTFRSADPR